MDMAQVVDRHDLRNVLPNAEASHQFEGEEFGDVAVSFFWTDAPAGAGPRLHQHVYAEVFVIQDGNVTFTVGDETLEATGGQIVIAPPGVLHRFVHAGPGLSRHLDIHPTGRMNRAPTGTGREIVTTQLIQRDSMPNSETAYRFEGREHGDVPVSFFWTDAPPGTGPTPHRHPYAEVFVIQEGRVTFTVGEETIAASGGEIVVVPAGTPHKFVNTGPGRSRHLDLHASGRMVTEWLEDRAATGAPVPPLPGNTRPREGTM